MDLFRAPHPNFDCDLAVDCAVNSYLAYFFGSSPEAYPNAHLASGRGHARPVKFAGIRGPGILSRVHPPHQKYSQGPPMSCQP